MRRSRSVYRLLLRLLPRPMREADGGEMTDLFERRLARSASVGETAGIWARGVLDVAAAAVLSRRRDRDRYQPLDRRGGLQPALQPHEGDSHMSVGSAPLATLAQDARFALRLLVRDRSFTATALATLAVCIAANTVVFAVVHAVVLSPLPTPHADRLIAFHNAYPNAGAPVSSNGVPDYFDRRDGMPAVDALALVRRTGATLAAESGAARLRALQMTPTFVDVVSATPALGRLFDTGDGEVGRNRKVVLSHGLWLEEFGGSPAVVGQSVRVNGEPHEIIGVLPAGYALIWDDIDLWLPAAFTPEERSDESRHSNSWSMIGRLTPGATLERAQTQLDAVNARNDERFPQFHQILKDAGFHSFVVGLQDELVGDVRTSLYLLWGGVLIVLVIGCVNIANLVLVRSTQRQREMATRQAVGAGVWRLRRQLVTEALLLTVGGGLAGLALGWWTLEAASALRLDQLPRGFEVQFGLTTVAVVLGLSVLVGLVLGAMSALRASRLDVTRTLRAEGRSGTAGRQTMFLRRALATVQIALAFVLLVAAGLLFQSFRAVLRIDPGFDAAGLMTASVSLPASSYRDAAARRSFADRLHERLAREPGVRAVGFTDVLPMSGDTNDSVLIPEGRVATPGDSLISPYRTRVDETYFSTMRIPVVGGRGFDARDHGDAPRVVIVDERLARTFWPGQDPIGKRVYQPESAEDAVKPGPNTQFITVVGVVGEVQIRGLATGVDSVGAYYFPLRQLPASAFTMAVRTDGDPAALAPALRRALREIDPELPLFSDQPMASRLDDALAGRRVPMLLSAIFGGVALFLATIGIYGVLAYGVAEQRREIGIRMALGSTAGQIFRLVLGDGLRIVVIGLAIGGIGVSVARQSLQTLLYDVRAGDPRVIAAVGALLALIAILATVLPARRATKVNPATALY